ncbi:hypothetical protein SAMN06269173_11149 [Hymenobacter mucosus]|uniref:Uncharacterized protein n=1 Tax=Hymenobacter mucosus TaxID=1411120 RepID=A0A239A7T7_9BACT|nr:hypothetical protein SAMN06269173_11149 [Hymenobacter mucosus]
MKKLAFRIAPGGPGYDRWCVFKWTLYSVLVWFLLGYVLFDRPATPPEPHYSAFRWIQH